MIKRVLVTGATGFIGSHLVRELLNKGKHVCIISRDSSDNIRISDVVNRCQVITSDFSDVGAYLPQMQEFKPQACLHLAWDGVKGADRNHPGQFRNVGYSANLFRACHKCSCRVFIGLGSQAEYGPRSGRISEDSPTTPTTAYGESKLATALLLRQLAHSLDTEMSFAWLRLFSSYGPGEDQSWLFPYLIQSLLRSERPKLTPGDQIWDFIHVADVVSAIILVMERKAEGIFNLGSGTAVRLKDTINQIYSLIRPPFELKYGEIPYRDDQVMHLEADTELLRLATDWSPTIKLRTGISTLIEHYRHLSTNNDC